MRKVRPEKRKAEQILTLAIGDLLLSADSKTRVNKEPVSKAAGCHLLLILLAPLVREPDFLYRAAWCPPKRL